MSQLIAQFERACDGFARLAQLIDLDWRACA